MVVGNIFNGLLVRRVFMVEEHQLLEIKIIPQIYLVLRVVEILRKYEALEVLLGKNYSYVNEGEDHRADGDENIFRYHGFGALKLVLLVFSYDFFSELIFFQNIVFILFELLILVLHQLIQLIVLFVITLLLFIGGLILIVTAVYKFSNADIVLQKSIAFSVQNINMFLRDI